MVENKIVMGKIASPYGVRGWSKVVSYTNPIENLLNYPQWEIQHQHRWQTIHIEKGKVHGRWLVVKIAGCNDREQAKLYTNNLVAIPREQLAPTPENEFYWSDLIGLEVYDLTDTLLGRIESLMETGANDVIVVAGKDNRQILIPYIKQVVKSVDLTAKKMTVDWEP